MLKIWTDGSCLGNPGNGGWAFVMTDGAQTIERSGGERDTTNNRMELTAVINALGALKKHNEFELFTDSQYVKNGVEIWMKNWKKNGWKTANRKPVANQDLWLALDALLPKFKIHWRWVKGHSGNEMNERCDILARTAAEKMP
ncbi:MAG: ribonuclease HI [Clostridiales bacterium]|nr:ribonuclease HI [Clostridiales bacterium]